MLRQRVLSKGRAMIFTAETGQKLPQTAQGLPGHGRFDPESSYRPMIFVGMAFAS